ncbi:probable fructokinase-7 [Medicago truncatula]|uniref:probable fructokinase-7 n=1 Tax=Medicago truncatula TaxID=3880 RepID=UPI0019677D00|nr:probable fructokinase-7 [Medicago truncatula]
MGKGKRRSKTAAAAIYQSLPPQHKKVPSKTVEISGDSDDHSLHIPLPPSPSTSDCPIYKQLIKLGFYLKREKVDDCLRQLGDSINGLNDLEKADICYRKFLFTDLNSCGSGFNLLISAIYCFNSVDVLGGGLVDDDNTHTVQAPPVSMPYSCSFDTHIQASNGFAGNLRNTKANKDGVPPMSRPYKLPDFPVTEGYSKTSGLVGADKAGYLLVDLLKENNVDTSGMRVDFDYNVSTKLAYVSLRADDDVREWSFSSTPVAANMLLYESELDRKLIKKAKIFHYGSIGLIYEQCKTSFLAALRFAKTCDCILSYDPKLKLALWPSAEVAREGIMSIWNLADVIKISKDEITHLIDAGDPCDDDDVIKKLFHPTLKLLIVTGGSEGCRYYTNDFKGKVRGLNVEPVDTTGAGDAFVSGILYYIASDPSIFKDEKRLRKALYFASVCGAIMVTQRGAISALPTKDDVLQSVLSIAAEHGAKRPKTTKRDAALQHGAFGESV